MRPEISVLVVLLSIAGYITAKSPLKTKLQDCDFRINEFNLGATHSDDIFVEIAAICTSSRRQKSKVNMKFFKLAFISAYGEIVGVCQHNGTKTFSTTSTWFFVYGGNNIATRDMSFRDCDLTNFNKNTGRYLPPGTGTPHAVVLIYNQRPEILAFVRVDASGNAKQLNASEGQIISRYLQDLFIYGSLTPYVTCEIFEDLLAPYGASNAKIVRDWMIYDNSTDYSANRCDRDMIPFIPGRLVYSRPTPNSHNWCSIGFEFRFEDSLPQLHPPRRDLLPFSEGKWRHCLVTTNTSTGRGTIASPERYEVELQYASVLQETHPVESMEIDEPILSNLNQGEDKITDITTEFDLNLTRRSFGNEQVIWDNCDAFPPSWKSMINNEKAPPLDTNIFDNKDICFWYELLPNGNGRCKLCHVLIQNEVLIARKKRITKIMSSEGYMYRGKRDSKYVNKRTIEMHSISNLHKISLQYFQNIDFGLSGVQLKESMMKKGEPYRDYYLQTENRHVVVYQAVRMKLKPYNFKVLVKSLEYFDVKIGIHHTDDRGFRDTLMNIDRMLRGDIINFLLTHTPHMSLMVDTSTDISGINSMAVIFQVFAANKSLTLFYRLLQTEGESGADLFRIFRESIEADGLSVYIKRYISGLTTDGCPSMSSVFQSELRNYVGNGLIYNWCYNHRLELAGKNSMKNFTMTIKTESFVNEIAGFYGAMSPKKRKVLHDAAAFFSIPQFELRRIQQIRWVASKRRAIVPICQHWRAIVKATEDIASDRGFVEKTRSSARSVLLILKDGTFLITLAWLADVTKLLTEVSETLQIRGSSLIGKNAIIHRLKEQLEDMKQIYGEFVSLLLSNSQYTNTSEGMCGLRRVDISVEDFETKPISLWNVPMNAPNSEYNQFRLHQHMNVYLQRIISYLDLYFDPSDKSDNFDVFYPPEMRVSGYDLQYGFESIRAINDKHEWNFDMETLLQDWQRLKTWILSHKDFEEKADLKPEDFWRYFLEMEDGSEWTDLTRNLLAKILVISSSSAEVERIFSIVTNEKTKQRYSLKLSTLSALVNINFNGASDLKMFDAHRYAKEFMKTHIPSDETGWSRAKKDEQDEDSFLSIFG